MTTITRQPHTMNALHDQAVSLAAGSGSTWPAYVGGIGAVLFFLIIFFVMRKLGQKRN
ncbi:hypothetical protein ACWEGQ_29040 [Streptomyces seoulensis]